MELDNLNEMLATVGAWLSGLIEIVWYHMLLFVDWMVGLWLIITNWLDGLSPGGVIALVALLAMFALLLRKRMRRILVKNSAWLTHLTDITFVATIAVLVYLFYTRSGLF